MKHKITTQWKNGMVLESTIGDHTITMDAKPEVGGENKGASPKKIMLSALTGCTGMDVLSLFKKMRQEVTYFNIKAEADLTEEHPVHYGSIRLFYTVRGENLDESKIKKAIDLSMERYCGISYMLGKAADISYDLKINTGAEMSN